MNFPPFLKSGDRVCVLSPSGPVNVEHLDFGIEVLKEWGLDIKIDGQTFARKRYLAGDDLERIKALQDAIEDPDIKAIFCSRGGYGLSRIVDELSFKKLVENPKWVVGFSDISALLLALFEEGVSGALHGPVLKSFSLQKASLASLRSLLFDGVQEGIKGKAVGKKKDARGQLWGGNLSLVLSELASDSVHIPDQAVVFLEDIGEADYRLDRLFTTFKRAARDIPIAALLLGQFNDCSGVYVNEEEFPAFIERLAIELSKTLNCPVIIDMPFGHTHENEPLLLGAQVKVSGDRVTFSGTRP